MLAARDVILWKDVPGLLTADPRVVPDARLIPLLHVREASELAYYGAKVLHPRSLIALQAGTRLIIRPYADPAAHGTEIVVERERKPAAGRTRRPVKALTAIADQTLLTIAGNGMVGVPGVAARAFGALERAGVSVSLISQASSEHSICMGIPTAAAALREAFAAELTRREIDAIEVRPDLATIAVVGLGMAGTPGVAARLFGALADEGVNVVAIAQGASELNISVVVEGRDAGAAQRAIHSAFRLGKIGGGAAVQPQAESVVIHHKRISPATSDDRYRIEALTVRDRHVFGPAVQRHARVTEILRNQVSRPAIFDAVELNKNPAVVFIRIVAEEIGFSVDVLNAAVGDAAGPRVFNQRAIGVMRCRTPVNERLTRGGWSIFRPMVTGVGRLVSLAWELSSSESTVDELVRRGVIPPPIKLTPGCVRWWWPTCSSCCASSPTRARRC